ncbi:MAG: chromosome segregation protein SMC, partial [Meiothermus sp.]
GEARLERLRAIAEPTPPTEPEPDGSTWQGDEAKLRELEAAIRAEETRLRTAQGAFERYLQAQAAFEVRQVAYQQSQSEVKALRAEAERLEAELAALSSSLESAEAKEAELRLRLGLLVQQEGALASEARAADAEAGRLSALLRSGSDLAEGPRKARESGIAGIIGIVADLLEVPPRLDLAVEVVLAGRVQWVLCESEAAAQAAIEYLKRQGGRATFLPRTALKAQGRKPRDWSAEAGVVGFARELVGLPACPGALPTLFGDALVLESLDAALALRKRSPDVPRMVTLEGELLEASGAITGGRVQKGGQMLALRRRLQEAAREAERLAAQAQAAGEEAQRVRAELGALELESGRRKRAELQAELRALQTRLSRPSPSQPQPPEPVPAPDLSGLEALRAAREALSTQLAGRRELSAGWARYREDLKRYREAQLQIGELGARALQLSREQAELTEKLEAARARRGELEAARASLNLDALEAALQAARQRTRALAEEESRLIGRTNAILSDLEALHLTQARREATVETLQTELSELPPGLVEAGSSRSLARTLAETEAALEALGPVNHLAEREYAALEEEVARLEAALAEAQVVVARLEGELREVEAEYRERLGAKYAVFEDKFAQYAESLLGAEVQLERVENGLNLVLKPMGKRTVSLELLSMGERTMGALAFLFALSEVGEGKGLPIAVLDEVDAPLDEANIQRFCRFLRHFAAQTQFILVTHQKRTMEACDALYGVTSEKGLSKVFSIKAAAV